jgi:hypothetical protein
MIGFAVQQSTVVGGGWVMQHMVGGAEFPDVVWVTTESRHIGAQGDRVVDLMGWRGGKGGRSRPGKVFKFGGGFAVQMTEEGEET